jgi:hypothetical protein
METIKNMGFSFIRPHIWPANSPDFNPLDNFFWNEVEERLKGIKHSTRKKLEAAIKKKIYEIPKKMIQEVIDQLRSRVHAIFLNKGGLILDNFL